MRPLAVLLFGGLPTLLWIGQVIWIAVMSAIYIRVILVITRKEELLEELDPRREPGTRIRLVRLTQASRRHLQT
jgi:hypothetical protein